VAALEDRLGTRLLHRTTRRVSLTPAGTEALERAERLLADLEELHDAVVGDGTPRGHCRVTAGVSLGHALLHEGLPVFLRQHPAVTVEVVLTDRHVDLVAERIDLAVRIGALADSELVAMRLGTVGHVVCAGPAWLDDQGPFAIDALEGIARVVDTNQPRVWTLSGPGAASIEVQAAGRYAVNSAHAARDACRAGLGLAMLPSFVARDDLEQGILVDALPGWRGPELGLYAVVLERRWMSAAVRALVEHVRSLVSA
ncbi:MAG: LysR substrate-binding domain-containing protein, partial [Myxococcota bacterium]